MATITNIESQKEDLNSKYKSYLAQFQPKKRFKNSYNLFYDLNLRDSYALRRARRRLLKRSRPWQGSKLNQLS